MSGHFVDRQQVARRFARAAASYGDHDFFAREIDKRMQERLDYVRLDPGCVLDLGCSRGGSLAGLAARFPQARQIAIDACPEMLAGVPSAAGWRRWFGGRADPLRIAARAENLPLKSRSTAVVWSNLLLHWLDDPLPVFAEVHRVLEVGGLFMFSALGPDTLKELRSCFADGYAHTQRFTDMHDLGDMLVANGFADPVMDMEVLTLTYDSFDNLLDELRAAGSGCAMTARRHGLSGRQSWLQVRAAYESLRREGRLPASFEVIYGHAWKAEARQTGDGRSVVRFLPAKSG